MPIKPIFRAMGRPHLKKFRNPYYAPDIHQKFSEAPAFSGVELWTVRDLNSRNGTAVGNERVTGDYVLKPQEIIWIASTQMAFVTDLSSAYNRKVFSRVEIGSETVTGLEIHDSDEQATMAELQLSEPTQITHRRQKTRYLQAEDPEALEEGPANENARSKASRNATRLCRLAFDLANETTPRAIATHLMELVTGATVAIAPHPPRPGRAPPPRRPCEAGATAPDVRPRHGRGRFICQHLHQIPRPLRRQGKFDRREWWAT